MSWEMVTAGVSDFCLDDVRLTRHALARARQRKVPLDNLRGPLAYCGILLGKTIITVLPPVAKPQLIPGRLFNMGHRYDPQPAAAAADGAPMTLLANKDSRHFQGSYLQHDRKQFTRGRPAGKSAGPRPVKKARLRMRKAASKGRSAEEEKGKAADAKKARWTLQAREAAVAEAADAEENRFGLCVGRGH